MDPKKQPFSAKSRSPPAAKKFERSPPSKSTANGKVANRPSTASMKTPVPGNKASQRSLEKSSEEKKPLGSRPSAGAKGNLNKSMGHNPFERSPQDRLKSAKIATVSARSSLPTRNSIKSTEKLNLSDNNIELAQTFQGQEIEKLKGKLMKAEKEVEA